jgi:hypothetical protein
MADEIEFPNGLIVKAPRDGAPDFVKASISIKVQDLMTWLHGKQEEWINLDVKESKGGKWYCAVNTHKPKESGAKPDNAKRQSAADMDSDIPF